VGGIWIYQCAAGLCGRRGCRPCRCRASRRHRYGLRALADHDRPYAPV